MGGSGLAKGNLHAAGLVGAAMYWPVCAVRGVSGRWAREVAIQATTGQVPIVRFAEAASQWVNELSATR